MALMFSLIALTSFFFLQKLLKKLDIFFAVAFTAELVLKCISFGILGYVKSPWNWLDAFVVAISWAGKNHSMFEISGTYFSVFTYNLIYFYCVNGSKNYNGIYD